MHLIEFIALFFALIYSINALCRDEPDGSFIADPSSRQRFFYCWNGESISGKCDDGKEFDPFERVCDTPQLNNNPQAPQNPCSNRVDGTFISDPSSRFRFFYCLNGQSISGTCENGKVFNPVEKYCEDDWQQTKNICLGQPDNTLFPDPLSNERFIYCRSGESFSALCPSGTLFDPNTLFCEEILDYPEPEPESTLPPPLPTRTTTSRPPITTRTTTRPQQPTRTTTRPTTRTTTRAQQPTRTTARPQQPTRATTKAQQPGNPTRPAPPTQDSRPRPTRPAP